MNAAIIKVKGEEVTAIPVSTDMTFHDMVELVSFNNFGKDIVINDLLDVYVPETDTRFVLWYFADADDTTLSVANFLKS